MFDSDDKPRHFTVAGLPFFRRQALSVRVEVARVGGAARA
jgi:hypothetical protein